VEAGRESVAVERAFQPERDGLVVGEGGLLAQGTSRPNLALRLGGGGGSNDGRTGERIEVEIGQLAADPGTTPRRHKGLRGALFASSGRRPAAAVRRCRAFPCKPRPTLLRALQLRRSRPPIRRQRRPRRISAGWFATRSI